jgi:hypothetical protein
VVDLIQWMLEAAPASRPDMDAVLAHPAFWDEAQYTLASLVLKSRVENAGDTPERRLVDQLDSEAAPVFQLKPSTIAAAAGSSAVTQLTTAEASRRWRTEFLCSLGASWELSAQSSQRSVPFSRLSAIPEDAAAVVAKHVNMHLSSVPSSAAGLVKYLRHFSSHM